MKMIKQMFGTMIDVTLGSETMKMVGSSEMPSWAKTGTNAFIGLGIMGNAASMSKKLWK
jgi:hypothetical protein